MRTFIILLCLLATLAFARPAHAAVNLQTCIGTPATAGGLVGCPLSSVMFAPVSPTTLVRSQVAGVQGWRPFSALKPADSVVSSDGLWHVLSTVQPALASTPTQPSPPVVTPPAASADVWVPMNWTCSIANHLATCTAPVTP